MAPLPIRHIGMWPKSMGAGRDFDVVEEIVGQDGQAEEGVGGFGAEVEDAWSSPNGSAAAGGQNGASGFRARSCEDRAQTGLLR